MSNLKNHMRMFAVQIEVGCLKKHMRQKWQFKETHANVSSANQSGQNYPKWQFKETHETWRGLAQRQ